MATPSHTFDPRLASRLLTSTSSAIFSDYIDTVFNHSVVASIFAGNTLGAFGKAVMMGQGKITQSGGNSIEVNMNLGKGQSGQLSGPFGEHGVAPSDTPRNSRALWKHYWSNATVSKFDLLANTGGRRLVNLVEKEVKLAMNTLVDDFATDFYANNGIATKITDISEVISAGDEIQSLSGLVHPTFNSRGLNGRTGVAPAAISFAATGAFATNGIQDMLTSYNNAREGAVTPNVILSDFASHEKYENSLIAQQQYTTRDRGDASFDALAFKNKPYFPDDKCTADTQYTLTVGSEGGVALTTLEGADFEPDEWKKATNTEAMVQEFMAKMNLTVFNRKLCNKVTGIS